MGSAVQIQGMISPEAMGKDNQRSRGLPFRQLKHTEYVSVGTLDNNLFHRHLRKYITSKEKENQYYRAQLFSHQITSPELYYKQYTKKLILKT
jgi:transposase